RRRRGELRGPSSLGGCGGRGGESGPTAMVTAGASTAGPMTCPPMSRTLSGRPADRSIVLAECRWLAPVPGAAADGEGDTCGNAEPRSPVGWIPTPGTVPVGSSPGGIVPGMVPGIVPPSPTFCVDVDVGSLDDFLLMSTVADADAEFDASAEVAVAVSVT